MGTNKITIAVLLRENNREKQTMITRDSREPLILPYIQAVLYWRISISQLSVEQVLIL
jgi:hypothetical protein